MADEKVEQGVAPEATEAGDTLAAHQHSLLELFEELSLRERMKKVAYGLKQPKDSGAYKYAILEVKRLWAPVSSVVVPCLAILMMLVFGSMQQTQTRAVTVQMVEPEPVQDLEDIKEIVQEPLEPPEPMDMDFTPDMAGISVDAPSVAGPAGPAGEFSPVPAQFDAVSIVRSPVVMRGIYGNRSPGARGKALAAYGGGGFTEGAVLRALRWLKKEQNAEGSWNNAKHAMTGMALLAFLAHGETPASEEFGPTVEKSIRWLIDTQDAAGGFPRSYQHAIATYALCEAYGLTRVPALKYAAEKAVELIIKGQNPDGGWAYALAPADPSDTSVMGWCAQALKAAQMAGLENEGLKKAMKQSVLGFKKNSDPSGGFGYRGPGKGGLTGVGTLCMQLLGAAKESECKNGQALLDTATFNWDGGGVFNGNYYWYYITQAKFHEGGERWNQWNKIFAPVLVKNQTVIKEGIAGPTGKMEDIGFWDMDQKISGHTDGPVMNTALATLQLEVYYRHLPTFKKPEEIDLESPDTASDKDIDVQVTL